MNKLKKILYPLINTFSFFYIIFYRLKNRTKKKIFIYTDSRGFEITKLFNRKTPFYSYVNFLIKNYSCDVHICPEKHTTFFDFFYELESIKKNKYDFILCHVGVVDFSPRIEHDVKSILKFKKNKIVKLFGINYYNNLLNNKPYSVKYNNKKTSSILNIKNFDAIIKKLNKIENLIWINCNRVIYDWNGNYKRKRPKNINLVHEKSIDFNSKLHIKKIIDLTKWNNNDIKTYTCDNIHFTHGGMTLIENKLKKIIK